MSRRPPVRCRWASTGCGRCPTAATPVGPDPTGCRCCGPGPTAAAGRRGRRAPAVGAGPDRLAAADGVGGESVPGATNGGRLRLRSLGPWSGSGSRCGLVGCSGGLGRQSSPVDGSPRVPATTDGSAPTSGIGSLVGPGSDVAGAVVPAVVGAGTPDVSPEWGRPWAGVAGWRRGPRRRSRGPVDGGAVAATAGPAPPRPARRRRGLRARTGVPLSRARIDVGLGHHVADAAVAGGREADDEPDERDEPGGGVDDPQQGADQAAADAGSACRRP